MHDTHSTNPEAVQLRLPGVVDLLDTPLPEIEPLLHQLAVDRQARRISRDESLEIARAAVQQADTRHRCELARVETSLLHILEVFALDPAPSVRAACASNPNAIDGRIQMRLAQDENPLVVLSLLDGVDPGREVVEWLIQHCPFETVRFRLAQRRLASDLLRRLRSDRSPIVAAAAAATLDEHRHLRAVA